MRYLSINFLTFKKLQSISDQKDDKALALRASISHSLEKGW